MKTLLSKCFSLFVFVVLFSFNSLYASGTWDGGGDGVTWGDAMNWSDDVVPDGTDDVNLTTAGLNIQIAAAGAVAENIKIENGAILTILAGGDLTLNNPGGSSAIGLKTNGVLNNSGSVSILATTADGIKVESGSELHNMAGGSITINGGVEGIDLDNFVFSNMGSISIMNTSNDGFDANTTSTLFNNGATGVITITNALKGMDMEDLDAGFLNDGIINVVSASDRGFDLDEHLGFINNGTIEVGTAQKEGVYITDNDGSFLNTGTFLVDNAAAEDGIYFNYVNLDFVNSGTMLVTYAKFEGIRISRAGFVSGMLTNSGTMEVVQAADKEGVYFFLTTVHNTSSGQIIVRGAGSEGLYTTASGATGLTFLNDGLIDVSNSDDEGLEYNDDIFTNNGTINITGIDEVGMETNRAFYNYGDVNISDCTKSAIEIDNDFYNYGTINTTNPTAGNSAEIICVGGNTENYGTIYVSGTPDVDEGVLIDNGKDFTNYGYLDIENIGDEEGIEIKNGDFVNEGLVEISIDDSDEAIYARLDGTFENKECGIINILSASEIQIDAGGSGLNSGLITSAYGSTNTGDFTNNGVLAEAGGVFAFSGTLAGTGSVATAPIPGIYPADRIGANCPVIPTISIVDADGDGIPDITDPCSCSDPLNLYDDAGILTHFHDFIEISATTGDTWVISATTTLPLYDNTGTVLPSGTVIPEIGTTGIFYLDVWHPDVVGFNADFDRTVGGVHTLSTANACVGAVCDPLPVPTVSQWGLITLSLFLLTFGMIYVGRRKLVLAGELDINTAFDAKSIFQSLPVNWALLKNAILFTMVLSLLAGVLTLSVYGSIAQVDVIGFMITGPLFAYLVHLMILQLQKK